MTEAITVIVIGLLWTLIAFLFEKPSRVAPSIAGLEVGQSLLHFLLTLALPAYVETIDKQHVLYYWMITLICMGSAYFVYNNILPVPALYVCALFYGSEVLAIFCLSTISAIVRYCILWLPHVHISTIFGIVPDLHILATIFKTIFDKCMILVAGSVYVQRTVVICCILIITAITLNRYLMPIVRDLKTLHADVRETIANATECSKNVRYVVRDLKTLHADARETIANATECSKNMRYVVDYSKDTSFYKLALAWLATKDQPMSNS